MLVCGIFESIHPFHIGFGVFLRHDIDAGWKERIAAGVIAVSMRVDNECDGLVTYCLDLIENRLTIVCKLGINDQQREAIAVRGAKGKRLTYETTAD